MAICRHQFSLGYRESALTPSLPLVARFNAGSLCGKNAAVGGWYNTFPIPFGTSAVVTVRSMPGDGCMGGYVNVVSGRAR